MFEQYFHLVSAAFLLALFALYLWFVLVFGPTFMKDREAFDVLGLIRLYNAFQVFACLFFVIRAHQVGFYWQFLWVCEKFENFSGLVRLEVKIGYWLFLALRCVEFVETVFFVVRKKHEQASFLHIFHHIGSVLMTWLFIVLNVGEHRSHKPVLRSSFNTSLIHRIYGRLYCTAQCICPHLHVHLLLLQLFLEQENTKNREAVQAIHNGHSIGSVCHHHHSLRHRHLAGLWLRIFLPPSDRKLHRFDRALLALLHQKLLHEERPEGKLSNHRHDKCALDLVVTSFENLKQNKLN